MPLDNRTIRQTMHANQGEPCLKAHVTAWADADPDVTFCCLFLVFCCCLGHQGGEEWGRGWGGEAVDGHPRQPHPAWTRESKPRRPRGEPSSKTFNFGFW